MLNHKINHKLTITLAHMLIVVMMMLVAAIAPLWAASQDQAAAAKAVELVNEHLGSFP